MPLLIINTGLCRHKEISDPLIRRHVIEKFFAQHFPGARYRIREQPSDAVLNILLQEVIAAALIQHTIGQVTGRFIIIPPDGWRQPLFKAIEVEGHGLRKACFESVEANLVQTFAALDDSGTLYDHPLHQHAFEGLHQLGGRGYPVLFDEARKSLLFVRRHGLNDIVVRQFIKDDLFRVRQDHDDNGFVLIPVFAIYPYNIGFDGLDLSVGVKEDQ